MKSSFSPLLWLAVFASTLPAQDSIRGFQTKDLPAQHELEDKARAVPDPARLRRYMEFMAAQPHHAGSARDKVVAEWALGQLKEWGLDAHIEEFEALLPWPTVPPGFYRFA